jgi:hypothetical protein
MPVTQLSSVLPALYCWLNPSTRPSADGRGKMLRLLVLARLIQRGEAAAVS